MVTVSIRVRLHSLFAGWGMFAGRDLARLRRGLLRVRLEDEARRAVEVSERGRTLLEALPAFG